LLALGLRPEQMTAIDGLDTGKRGGPEPDRITLAEIRHIDSAGVLMLFGLSRRLQQGGRVSPSRYRSTRGSGMYLSWRRSGTWCPCWQTSRSAVESVRAGYRE
jgi:hypothetical protein